MSRFARMRSTDFVYEDEARLLFAHNPLPMWIFDRETLAILIVNGAAVRQYGYLRDELLGMTVTEMRPPEDQERFLARIKQGPPWVNAQWRHRKKDGTIINVEVFPDEIVFRGRPAVLALMRDVTAQKAAEEALREASERSRLIVESAHDAFVALDAEGRIVSWNTSAEVLFGWRRAEALGRAAAELLVLPSDREAHEHRRAALLASADESIVGMRYEVTARRRDGIEFPIELSMSSVKLRGAPLLCAFVRDLTAAKAAEAERARLLESERAARAAAQAALAKLSGLHAVTDATLGSSARDEVLGAALARLREVLAAEAAAVLLLTAGEENVDAFVSEAGAEAIRRPRVAGLAAGVGLARHATPTLVDDLAGEIVGPLLRTAVRSLVAVPLVIRGRPAGALLCARVVPRGFGRDDVELLELVADRLVLAVDRSRLFEELRDSRGQLERLASHLVAVQEQERRALARELHDEIGQLLTGLKLMLGAEPAAPEVGRIVDELLARVRDLTMTLRPPMLDDLGLVPALCGHLERFTAQTRVRVRFTHRDVDRRFPPEIETASFRIVQEALTNVARHAGVNEAQVDLWCDGQRLGLRVEDHGVGFPGRGDRLLASSTGLSGMRERARLVGGQLRVVSARGAGVQVRALLPLMVEEPS